MRVAVIGAGAVGGILSAHLGKAGAEVFVVEILEKVQIRGNERGFRVTGQALSKTFGEFNERPVNVVSDLSKVDHPVQIVFVCVKTTDQEIVVSSLKKVWNPGTVCVSFQNGIDTEDMLFPVAGVENTLRVVVNFAGNVVDTCVYKMNWFNPPNYIGAVKQAGRKHAEMVADILNRARLTTVVVDDIKRRSYEKTVLNVASPLCALTGMTMEEVMTQPDTKSLASEILKEGRLVGDKMGWKFEHTLEDWLQYVKNGGDHKPSMRVDMEEGRPTEIVFMNKKICEIGAKVGVPTPYNNAIVSMILGKEFVMTKKTR